MNNHNRIKGGLQAKRIGDSWEHRIQSHAFMQKFHVIQIPAGCKTISKFKTIRIRTPFDFVLVRQPKCIFIDTKTTKQNRFPMDKATAHQIHSLVKCEEQGHSAGLLVWFRNTDAVIFFSAKKVFESRHKSSLEQTDGINIGTVLNLDFEKVL